MRFLGVGSYCDLGDMYLRLAASGHAVRVYGPEADGVMSGMLEHARDASSTVAA